MKSTMLIFLLAAGYLAQAQSADDILPPAPAWKGQSRALAVPAGDPWVTPFEAAHMKGSPSYEETVAWLRKLVAAAPELKMISIGTSLEGRHIYMVIASAERVFDPAGLRATGKPLFLAQAGIHAGEIDGKDAGMMLLRDMTVRGVHKGLLAGANFLFIPILSVDGHERASKTNRINQRGPEVMGWRTNGRNLNLNRDYTKLETREIGALVDVLNTWQPDLYFDIHVTDGMDYQYDITYGFNGPHAYSPAIAHWLADVLKADGDRALQANGHVPGPLIFANDDSNPLSGIVDWTSPPRFSNGYGDARHLPTVLVENHSLKPYDQRVLGTYVLLRTVLATLARDGEGLRRAIAADSARRPETVPLAFTPPEKSEETIDFLGIRYETVTSPVSGGSYLRWLGEPENLRLPLVRQNVPATLVNTPAFYWVSSDWPEVIEKLARHGVEMEHFNRATRVVVTMYRIREAQLAPAVFEGRMRVTGKPEAFQRSETFPAGSVRISLDQPLSELIVLLLEPDSQDSFFQWGYFNEILQRTEYFEQYAVEPLALRMMAADPALKAAFEEKLAADEAFAASPRARLNWFYERSPYTDDRWLLYPVGRVDR